MFNYVWSDVKCQSCQQQSASLCPSCAEKVGGKALSEAEAIALLVSVRRSESASRAWEKIRAAGLYIGRS